MKQKEQTTGKNQTAAETQAAGKTLEEMNLLDDFLFGTALSYPDIGEKFVRILLKTIFGREFKHLSVTAQKVLYGADTGLHGARLDVYIEPGIKGAEEGRATVYDIEPDQKDSLADKKALPRRVRFYHGKIAARSLMHYMEETIYKNAVNEELRELHRMIETVKMDPEVGGMRIQIIEENVKMSQKIEKQAAEIEKQATENARLAEENAMLREELLRREAAEKATKEC